ncbi:DegV family protein [Deinococcus sp. Marseille-Q6407]|uniref:DegV family protein n=1 Tax=Deinococcus sp. Marseille-Q6407 TaxID=2969223 RepID=UPI0021BE3263|nr:DegV family protein [Deinococcus sp. Marseille-Q6407]
MSVAIVTDSTADLSPGLCQRWGITSLPLTVHFGEQSYRDVKEITLPQVLERVRAGEKIPGTSQPAPGIFFQAYSELLQTHDAVVSVHVSRDLSGVAETAQLVAREFGDRVTVLDSRTATMPLGLLALRAAQAAAAGQNAAEIVSMLERLIPYAELRFSVESLEYLRQNGRIGGAAGLLGSVLNIKPVLTIQRGRIEPAAKFRGVRRAAESMVSDVLRMAERHGEMQVGYVVTPGGEELVELLRTGLAGGPVQELGTFMVGGVIGSHVGPGGFGLGALPLNVPV